MKRFFVKFKFTIFFLCCSLLQLTAQECEDTKLMHFPQEGVLKRIITEVIPVPYFAEVTNLHNNLARKNISIQETKAEISQAITYYFDYLRRIELPEKNISNFESVALKNEQRLINKIQETGIVVKNKRFKKNAMSKAKL